MVKTLEEFVNGIKLSFENHIDIIFVKDTSSTYMYTNKAYRDYNSKLEYPIIGKSNRDIFDGVIAESIDAKDREVIEGGKAIEFEMDIVEYPYSPEENHFIITKSPIFDDDNNIIGILGIAKKLSSLIETRNMLETQFRLVDGLLNSIPYPVFLKDQKGRYQKVNQAFLTEMGREETDVIGKTDHEILGKKAGMFYEEKDKKIMDTGIRDIYISQSNLSSKRHITIKDPIRDHSGDIIGVLGVVNRHYELDELHDDILQVQKINSIAQLAGGISHDLNNILTSVSGLSSLLLLEDDIPEKYRDQIEIIYNASKQAAALIEKLQTFASRSLIDEEEIHVNEVVKDMVDLLESNYAVQVDFKIRYCDEETVINGDPTQLRQLVMNLIINGIEAMNHGGTIEVETRITRIQEHDDFVIRSNFVGTEEYVMIRIKDQGSGIDHNSMSHIFEPYYTTKIEGSGMGLAIVYGVISSHNGLLQLDTGEKGTEFRIYLPKKEVFFT